MNPAEFVAELTELVASGHDREAIAFSMQYWATVAPRMTTEQIMWVSDLMEGAETAVECEDAVNALASPTDAQTA